MATLCTRHADTVRMGGFHAYFNSLFQPDEQYRPAEHIHVEHHRTGHLPAIMRVGQLPVRTECHADSLYSSQYLLATYLALFCS